MLTEGKRGLTNIGRTVQNSWALGDYSEGLVTNALPRYYNLAAAGLLFHFASGTITATTNTTLTPLAAGTGIPTIQICNPVGSGKNVVIVKVGACNLAGTPPGPLVWNYAQYVAITATASSPVNALVGGPASVMKVYSNVVTTGSAVGIFYKDAASFNAAAAAGGGQGSPFYEDVGGDLIIPEGYWAALATYATATNTFQAGLTWAEIPK